MRDWTQINKRALLGVTAAFSSIEIGQSLFALKALKPGPDPATARLPRDCAKLIVGVREALRLPPAPDDAFARQFEALLREIESTAQPCAADGVAPSSLTKQKGSWQALMASQGL